MASKISYHDYMLSERWRLKSRERLRIDGYECQTCCSKANLEVHHKHYKNFGNEKMEDLLVLCHKCHEAITKRMQQHKKPPKQHKSYQPQYRI